MGETSLLVLAIATLAAGPVLHLVAGRARWTFAALDGFVLTAVGSLVLLQVAPRAMAESGWAAVTSFASGLLAPILLNRLRISWTRTQSWMVGFGVFGLVAHSALDGAAIAQGEADLASAIIVHRIPAGMFVWWLLRPSRGAAQAAWVLVGMGAATALGFAGGQSVVALEGAAMATFEGFVAGALLHVLVAHGPELHGDHPKGHSHVAELSGAGLAVALFLALPSSDDHGVRVLNEYGARFLRLCLEAAPALLLGYTAAGLFSAYLPRNSVRWLRRGSSAGQAGKGVLFGAPIPVCSCGVLPVFESISRRGAPPAAGLAFLVATPELGVESILLSVPLLGWDLALARVGAALVLAFAIGALLGARLHASPLDEPAESRTRESEGQRLRAAARFGYGELVDHTMGWIVLGIAIAALFDPGSLAWLASVPPWLQVFGFAALSVPMYVCASGATPLAAALIAAGASPGAALAFLLAGPATNITTFGVLQRTHGRFTALAFGASVLGGAALAGLGLHALGIRSPGVPWTSDGHAHASWLAWACLAALGGLTLVSLLRLGPRHLLMTVLRPLGGNGGHHHGHDHGHTHEPALP